MQSCKIAKKALRKVKIGSFRSIILKLSTITNADFDLKMANNEISSDDRKTLFVYGITDEVDQEILYELFQNVSTPKNAREIPHISNFLSSGRTS